MCNWPHLTQRGLLKEKACGMAADFNLIILKISGLVPQRRMDSMLIGVPMPLMGDLKSQNLLEDRCLSAEWRGWNLQLSF